MVDWRTVCHPIESWLIIIVYSSFLDQKKRVAVMEAVSARVPGLRNSTLSALGTGGIHRLPDENQRKAEHLKHRSSPRR